MDDKLKSMLRRMHGFLHKMETVKYILLMSILGYSLSIILMNVLYILFEVDLPSAEAQSYSNTFEMILFALVLAPIVETFIFQKLIIDALDDIKWFKTKAYYVVLISGAAFGFAHLSLSIYHAVCATAIGLLLGYSFLMYKRKGGRPFVVTGAIHSLLNALSIVISSFN